MKKILTLALVFSSIHCFGQVSQSDINGSYTKLFAQAFSKDISDYLTKVYIARDVLKLKENETTGFEIDAVTAAKSGELTTILYNCPKLNQKGMVLVFWNKGLYNLGLYSFYHFEYDDANILLQRINDAIESNKEILDDVNTSVLKLNDIHFIFAGSSIRVVWGEYDSLWDKFNFRTTYKRFGRFFKKQFKSN
ncbi:hypothetical protein [Mucilaginibacter sp.]|jgi:hypothetical protein|uniref:hypothetical protein n=1 Tax=Mucilaginibacter sp. TaxID=1882438 RepID=UPI002CA8161A|nr:hypothetical protein [Mucilaginibacter sp.]HTI60763.1 hypothetical protein [Mucilaginibacter sp.]